MTVTRHTAAPEERRARARTRTLPLIALVVAAVGSPGAPLITSVATTPRVSLAAAQWTLTITGRHRATPLAPCA